jgi:hypothetical protein
MEEQGKGDRVYSVVGYLHIWHNHNIDHPRNNAQEYYYGVGEGDGERVVILRTRGASNVGPTLPGKELHTHVVLL